MRNLFAFRTLRGAASAGLLVGGLSLFSTGELRAQDAPPAPEAAPAPEQTESAPAPELTSPDAVFNGYAGDCGCASCECETCDWCDLGDPWALSDHLCDECSDISIGGWTQLGYHDRANAPLMFNTNPHEINLHQQWFYAEKLADGECGTDWGFRFDILYGLDGENTQAFGNPPGTWDFQNGFDHGIYHWAIPQLYAEVASGDWNWKVGHFFTPAGYEVVAATGNFFYSHMFTHVYSEPFTHSGVLGTYQASDDLVVYTGWTAGWDTGFERHHDGDNSEGSNFLGGFAYTLTEGTTFTYITTVGDFGWRAEGYTHHVVLTSELSDQWTTVLGHDLVETNIPGDHQYSLYGYLFYTVNDCLKYGVRGEWWKTPGSSIYDVTVGINYRPHANLVIRPEYRYQWADGEDTAVALGIPTDVGIFGIDAVLSY